MVLSAHAVVGGAIGSIVKGHPILAFIYGFVSHFILDMIPHFDYPIRSSITNPHGGSGKNDHKDILKDFGSVGLDMLLGLVLSFIFFGSNGDNSFAWLWGVVGGVLPDFFHFVYANFKKPPFSWFQKIHEGVHTSHRLKNHPVAGMVWQAVFIVLVIYSMNNYFGRFEDNILTPALGEVQAKEDMHKEKKNNTATTTILFLGDMMLGRNVEVLMKRDGADYPFREINSFLAEADYVVGNLEGPIKTIHTPTPMGSMKFSFSDKVAELLASSSVDAVSLANNHTWDGGSPDYWNTATKLVEQGVGYFGHPVLAASSSYIIKNDDGDIEVFGFNSTYPTFELDQAKSIIKEAETESENKIIIAFMHWGNEYELIHSMEQRKIAEGLIEAGADLIIGAHPHVVQDVEIIDGVPVVYSLGNFIFDQYFEPSVEQGLIAELEIGNVSLLKLHPIHGNHSQPKLGKEKIVVYPLYFK